MRVRDAEIYDLYKAGYRLAGRADDIEVWAMPGDPDDFWTIRAGPELSPKMRDALIDEFERMGDGLSPSLS